MSFVLLPNRKSFLFQLVTLNLLLHLIYCIFDIWGPNSTVSINGHRYYITIVDDFTRHTWIFFLKHKSKAANCLISFITMVETQFSTKIKSIRSDNGPEFNLVPFFFQRVYFTKNLVLNPLTKWDSVVQAPAYHDHN